MKFLLAMLGASVVAVSPALATDLIVPVTPEERATHSLDTISSLQIGGAFIGSDDSDYDGSGIFKIGGETRIHMSRERFAVQFEGLGSSS